MQIMSYMPLNKAQEETLKAFEKVSVRKASVKGSARAIFENFQGQQLNVTIDESGVITGVEVWPAGLATEKV